MSFNTLNNFGFFPSNYRQIYTKMIKLIMRCNNNRPGGEIGRRTGLKILRL